MSTIEEKRQRALDALVDALKPLLSREGIVAVHVVGLVAVTPQHCTPVATSLGLGADAIAAAEAIVNGLGTGDVVAEAQAEIRGVLPQRN